MHLCNDSCLTQVLELSASTTEAVGVVQQGSCAYYRALPGKKLTEMPPVMRMVLC